MINQSEIDMNQSTCLSDLWQNGAEWKKKQQQRLLAAALVPKRAWSNLRGAWGKREMPLFNLMSASSPSLHHGLKSIFFRPNELAHPMRRLIRSRLTFLADAIALYNKHYY